MRSAALVAARPQPDVVGEEQGDAAFALAREQQQRLVVRPLQDGGTLGRARIDQTEPAAPVRGLFIGAFETARDRMALAEIGELRAKAAFGHAAARLGRQDHVERRAPNAGLARVIWIGRYQLRAAFT